jgi:hypothetical protein
MGNGVQEPRMRVRIRYLLAAAICVAQISRASAGSESSERLALGMPQQEVVRIMGRPTVVRLERNGVVCLAYLRHENQLATIVRAVVIVAFHQGAFVSTEYARFNDVDQQCSDIAGAWDLPSLDPLTCFRKFWLRCP